MTRSRIAILTLVVVAVWCSPSGAEKGSIGVAVGGGLRGLGGELVLGLNETLNLRAGLLGFKYTYSGEVDDTEYDLDLGLLTASALVDWHMLRGGFRLSGGFMLNKNKIDAVAEPGQSFEIGDGEYAAGEITNPTGRIDFNDVAAYLGIGWGNAVGKDKKLGVALDLGAMFQGSANVKLDASLISDNAQLKEEFERNLRAEEERMKDDLKEFKYYPVLGISLTYKIQ